MHSVSVAMAVYNGEKYLSEQIDSILCQLSEADELVISYDDSTDRTLEIIREYCDPRIKLVFNPGKGLFSNFNNAICNCTKDYIFISDQDDIWLPKKIESVLEVFRTHHIDMVIHNGVHINKQKDIISADFFSMYTIKNGLIRNFIKPRYSGCCTAFVKSIKEKIVPIPLNVGAYDHWIGMVGEIFGKVYFLDQVLIHHRLHDENVTPRSRRKLTDIFKYRWNLLHEIIRRK